MNQARSIFFFTEEPGKYYPGLEDGQIAVLCCENNDKITMSNLEWEYGNINSDIENDQRWNI